MSYKTIIPADDWYFVVEPASPQSEPIIWPLAMWALTERGQIVGLITNPKNDMDNSTLRGVGFVPVPPLSGMYKRRTALTPEESRMLEQQK